MFGYVTANAKDLDKSQKQRYGAVYCGICRQIRERSSQTARLSLSYDMAFLALLLMSLYEPEETAGKRACGLHPIKPRPWVDSTYIRYAADMNVALAYYKALDDVQDDGSKSAKLAASVLQKSLPEIEYGDKRKHILLIPNMPSEANCVVNNVVVPLSNGQTIGDFTYYSLSHLKKGLKGKLHTSIF